jgi:hypothetical protein
VNINPKTPYQNEFWEGKKKENKEKPEEDF